MAFEAELRLAWAVALNVLVFAAALWYASAKQRDRLQVTLDSFLLYYLVQYVTIGLLGVMGLLTPLLITITAILLATGLVARGMKRGPSNVASGITNDRVDIWVLGCALVAAGIAGVQVYLARYLPVLSNDAMGYHVPAAVHWLRTGSLGTYEAWFYNPANSYSPLGGSIFITWGLAPLGNDVLARFVQVPAVLFLFLGVTQLGRFVGARPSVAALVAMAAVLSRPVASQMVLAKDDLFLAAFFIAAVVACRRSLLAGPAGAARVGVAVGLFLGVKYTSLMSIPLLLLLIDMPWRARWRWKQWLTAAVVASLLAGPWFVRNALLTGNPLFPVQAMVGNQVLAPGLFATQRSHLLSELGSIWNIVARGYYGLSPVLTVLLIVGWAVAVAMHLRQAAHRPLVRLCLVGPLAGLGLFVAASPYGEIRYVFPSLMLLFACVSLVSSRLMQRRLLPEIMAAFLVVLAVSTGFEPQAMTLRVGVAVATASVGLLLLMAHRRFPGFRQIEPGLISLALLIAIGATYIHWAAYLRDYRYAADRVYSPYGQLGDAWTYVRTELPATSVIAYTNTNLTLPLLGFEYDRVAVYVPTRPGVSRHHDLPPREERLTGEQIVGAMVEMLVERPDRELWLESLASSGAEYLFVGKQDLRQPTHPFAPPELDWARQDPRFQPIYENRAATLFKLHPTRAGAVP